MSRKIVLPKIDQDFLDGLDLPYRVGKIDYEDVMYVIIYNVGVNNKYYTPDGRSEVDICMILPPGYPNNQIDMTHFYPNLRRIDNQDIPNTYDDGGMLDIDDVGWQTWSRHRVGADAWDPRRDCIATHLLYTEAFLKREVADLIEKNTIKTNVVSTFTRKTEEDILIFPRKFEAKTEKPSGGRLVINFRR